LAVFEKLALCPGDGSYVLPLDLGFLGMDIAWGIVLMFEA
jgi:hypothetical protein